MIFSIFSTIFRKCLIFAAWLIVGSTACSGTIGGPQGAGVDPSGPGSGTGGGTSGTTGGSSTTGSTTGGSTTVGTGTGGGPGRFACQGTSIDPGPTTMPLLTSEQYLNTVHDLFGPSTQLDALFPRSNAPTTFGLVQGNVAQVDLETYAKGAELVGAAVVADTNKLNAMAPCAANADKRTCARTFVQTFGARVYRAPVTDAADVDRHLALYDLGASTSYAHGIEMVLRGMLQAPRFLYRAEPGTNEQVGPTAVKLSGFEVATRLSYALWNTMPDAKLTSAASAGELATKAGVAAQLAWMIADPRGSKAVRRFLEEWIHLSEIETVVKDGQVFPDWGNATIRTAMRGQADSFFDFVLTSQSGNLSSLFTSGTVFVNQALAGYYGVAGTAQFQPIERTDGTASGMLTLPALLATLAKPTESSPIYRGKFVREELLCQQLPPPPPNVPRAPDTKPGVSTREKFKQHETDALCAACHKMIDPIGFGFENFDAVGRYRTTDNGAPVDASGEIIDTVDADGKFSGVAELGQKLAASVEVQECVARQWFRFFLSRFEQDVDGCSMKSLVGEFHAGGHNLNSLPLALVQTDAFMYRRPID